MEHPSGVAALVDRSGGSIGGPDGEAWRPARRKARTDPFKKERPRLSAGPSFTHTGVSDRPCLAGRVFVPDGSDLAVAVRVSGRPPAGRASGLGSDSVGPDSGSAGPDSGSDWTSGSPLLKSRETTGESGVGCMKIWVPAGPIACVVLRVLRNPTRKLALYKPLDRAQRCCPPEFPLLENDRTRRLVAGALAA